MRRGRGGADEAFSSSSDVPISLKSGRETEIFRFAAHFSKAVNEAHEEVENIQDAINAMDDSLLAPATKKKRTTTESSSP